MRYRDIIESMLDNFIVPNFKSARNYISNRTFFFGKYTVVHVKENTTLNQVLGEYKLYDLRKDDVVLDIGANVGGFSMLVCGSVKSVYAVEPQFTDILAQNVKNNHIKNINVIDVGLGLSPLDCKFMSRKKVVNCVPLSQLIEMCGGKVDFLKCDCEGGEWAIQPHELKGIRRIEAEIHSFNNEDLSDFSDMLLKCGYTVDITDKTDHTVMIHAILNRSK